MVKGYFLVNGRLDGPIKWLDSDNDMHRKPGNGIVVEMVKNVLGQWGYLSKKSISVAMTMAY